MRLNIDVIQREMENLKELRNVNLLDVVDHLSDGSYRLKANIFPSSGAVYAFWWTGSSEHFLAGDVNRIMRFKGPNGRNVDVEFSDDWINQIHVDGKIPLYVGKTADSLHKRLSLHLQLKTKRGLSLGEKALSEERKTTSNQVRDRIERMFLNEAGDKKNCRLLSVECGGRCVLEDSETKEIYLDTQAELVLPSLPSGLIVKPALVWKTDGKAAEDVLVSYLSGGFTWTANYVVELKYGTLNLIGWAEIENKCGMSFENAKIKLIAGEVNRFKDDEDEIDSRYYVCESAAAPQAEEKAFFDYHMYTLNQRTTLKDNQSKQICILSGNQIPYKQYYKLDLHEEKADVIVEFINRKDDGLGIAMPKGKIKLYKEDEADGSLEFIGEDHIEHTAKDETLKLSIGKAFDIAFEYSEVDRKKAAGFEHYTYECIIRNHKNTEAEISFEPYVWGIWEMVKSSHEFIKKTATQLEYRLSVPADSEVLVRFEYKIDRRTEVIVKK